MILYSCIAFVLLSMVLLLMRALRGPSIFDRLLAANSFNAKTVVLILCISMLANDETYIDVGLIYVITSFIAAIAFQHYFRDENNNSEDGV